MSQSSIEERLTALEEKVDRLIAQSQKPVKDWRSTFGMFVDDPEFDEVLKWGREFRDKERDLRENDVGARNGGGPVGGRVSNETN